MFQNQGIASHSAIALSFMSCLYFIQLLDSFDLDWAYVVLGSCFFVMGCVAVATGFLQSFWLSGRLSQKVPAHAMLPAIP